MSILYVIAIIAAIVAAPAIVFRVWNGVARIQRRRAARLTILPAFLVLGCDSGPVEIVGSGTGGEPTTTTATACPSAACYPGSYPVCDDGSTPAPCCDNGAPTTQCVLPQGVLVHSPACDALCGTPAALMSSCAMAADESLTCCLGGVCADGGAK